MLSAGPFGTFESGRLEDPFLNTAGVALIFYLFIFFFRFCWVFLQTFDVFQLLGQIWGFLSNVGMFRYGRGFLVHFNPF